MNVDLQGKTALVTGAAGGIGQAVCRLLESCGARAAYCDQDNQRQKMLAAGVAGGQIFTGDITDPQQARRLTHEVIDTLGGLDILVNCAGISAVTASTRKQQFADWKRVVEVNLQGTYLMCQAAGQQMCAQRSGSVINVSSAVAIAAVPADNAYGVAKAAVITLTKTLATEWAKYGIRVNCVAPGCIDAGMFQVPEAKWREQFLRRTPMGRFGAPDEVANAVAFLVSDLAGFITGVTLPIDGGWVAYGGSGAANEGH